MRSWTLLHSIAEGMRNIWAAPFLFGAVTITSAAVTGAGAMADLAVMQSVIGAEQEFLAAGGDILRATATKGVIDSGSCAALRNTPGVKGAAAVFEERMRITGHPDHLQTVLVATPGFEQIVDVPPLKVNEVIASERLANRWAWSSGTNLNLESAADVGGDWRTSHSSHTIAAITDLASLGDAASTSIVVVAPPIGDATTCFVRATPHMIESVADTIPAALREDSDTTIQVARQVYTGEFSLDPAADFAQRATRWASVAGGLVLSALLSLIVWTRRQRSALYAILGLSVSGRVQVRWTEAFVPLSVGASWGACWAALAGLAIGIAPETALVGATLHSLTTLSIASAVMFLTCLWEPQAFQALKDR